MKHLKTYKLFEGKLSDEIPSTNKKEYPYNKIEKLVKWFEKYFKKNMEEEGWLITTVDLYYTDWLKKDNTIDVFKIEKIDEPNKDQAINGELKDDAEAGDLAVKYGLLLDIDNIIYGFDENIMKKYMQKLHDKGEIKKLLTFPGVEEMFPNLTKATKWGLIL